MMADIADATAIVDEKRDAVARVEETVTQKEALASSSTRQAGSRRGQRQNYASMANPNARDSSSTPEHQALADARTNLKAAEDNLAVAEDSLAAKIVVLDKFKEGKLITKSDFMAHGRSVVKPGFDYYRTLFLDPSGDYYSLKQAYHVARIFNVRTAATLDAAAINEAINELNVFKMPEFTPAFREGMKKEVAVYKAAVNLTALRDDTDDDFWSGVEGAAEYDTALKAKSKTWLDDPVEKARRLWEWWRVHHAE